MDCERLFDDELGFRARREHVAADLEVAVPELAVALNLGHRLPPCAACNERLVGGLESGWWCVAPSGQVLGSVPAECEPREHFRIDRGVLLGQTGGHEPLARRAHALV